MGGHMLTEEQVAAIGGCCGGTSICRLRDCEFKGCEGAVRALLTDRAELVAEVERLNATIWESLFCGESAPGKCDVRTCKGRWLCSRMTKGWTPKENTDD